MRRLYSFFAALFFIAFAGPVAAQNLVSNPSFETHTSCPNNFAQLSFASPWNQPTGGTPDYYNTCATDPRFAVPSNHFGNQTAHSGNAYAGFILNYPNNTYSEYIQAPLLSPLIAGQNYKVSFYVSLAEASEWAIDGIGAYLSNGLVSQNNQAGLPQSPQVSNPSGNIISDKAGWVLVQGNFVASGGENYIVIGKFNNANLATAAVAATAALQYYPQALAYYFIDDVSVEAIICQPPKVPGPKPGSCVCPPETMQLPNGSCVSPYCKPPKVPGSKPGSCICPPGTMQLPNGSCVSPYCKPPKVPGSKPGSCICPPGTVPHGRECVKKTVCVPPAKLNRRGVCECPGDMVMAGDTCAERKLTPQLNLPGTIPGRGPRGGQDGPATAHGDSPGASPVKH